MTYEAGRCRPTHGGSATWSGDVSSGFLTRYQRIARGARTADSLRFASCCLGCLAERLVKGSAGQSASVVIRKATAGGREVKLVLSLLEQLLPHVYGDDDALCAPV